MPDFVVVCEDTQVVPQPVDGVLVRIFNQAGDTFITSGTTGDVAPGSGEVELTVPSDGTYRAKFSMSGPGWSIVSPQFLDVPVTDDAVFEVTAELFQHPAATDPRLCRASGFVVRINGQPAEAVEIFFENTARPILYDEDAVLGKKVRISTDEDGYGVVDLLRGGFYRVTIQGLEDIFGEIEVPDRAWVNLPDLLFPVIESVSFDPTAVAMSVGDVEEVTPTFTYRSGVIRALGELAWEQYSIEFVPDPDNDGLALSVRNNDTLQIQALQAGSYNVTVQVVSSCLKVLPDYQVTGSLPVTVT